MEETIKEERKVVELSIDDILPNRFQPRIKFEDSAIFELSESIKAHGVFQPIIVRPIGDKYEIIAGERRYKASVLAGKKTVPAIIMNINDNDTIEIALIENVQRANLTPIEEAISYKKILDMGYINQEQLASKLGKTQSTIANKLRLLNLDEEVQEALLENKISERHARSLLRLKDYEDQRKVLKKIITERLTVRKTDEEINNMLDNNQNIETNPITIDPIAQALPAQSFIPEVAPVFGDVNNQVINPSEIMGGVNNSTVISSNMNNVEVPKVETPVMDIQSIANTATDFNVTKPVAPMDQFLASSNPISTVEVNESPVSDSSSDDSAQNMLRPGKFFNFSLDEEPKPAPSTQADNLNSERNFNFDNFFGVPSPAPVQSAPEVPVEQPASDPFGINNTFTEVPASNPFGFAPTVPTETPVVEQPMPESNPFIAPTQEIIDMPSMPNSFVDPAVMSENVISVENNGMPIEEMPQTEVPAGKNIMTAVNTVRSAIANVESLGFMVDVDEIDLESMYQIIVKIEK